jgi:hypothetical protein
MGELNTGVQNPRSDRSEMFIEPGRRKTEFSLRRGEENLIRTWCYKHLAPPGRRREPLNTRNRLRRWQVAKNFFKCGSGGQPSKLVEGEYLYGWPKRARYSGDEMNANTISALEKLPPN